jgi:hypothetical protein
VSITLQTYTQQCQQLLHDATFQFYTQPELTTWINRARNQLTSDTGCNRTLFPISVNTQQESYPYGSVTGMTVNNGGSGYSSTPTITIAAPPSGTTATGVATVINGVITSVLTTGGSGYLSNPAVTITDATGTSAVLTATVLPQTIIGVLNFTLFWGNLRVVLRRFNWTWFNAWVRAWQQQLSRPAAWSQYNAQTIYLGPIPDQTYAAEVDCVVTPPALVNLTDVDVIYPPWQEAVPFYACYLAKQKEQSFQESEGFLDQYKIAALRAVRQSSMFQSPIYEDFP